MRSTSFLASLLLVGCAGQAPGIAGDPDAALPTVDAAPTPDGPAVDVGQRISGKAMDYFTNLPVDAAMVSTDGISPALMATAGTDGAYALDHVPTGSKLFLSAIRTNYKLTRNVATTVAATPVLRDAYLIAGNDLKRQYTSVGLPAPVAGDGKAFVEVELRMLDGTPLVGIPITNIKLLDALNAPVTIAGTYFIGANGDTVPNPAPPATPLVATAYVFPAGTPSRSRVALLGVPAGTYTLSVTYTPAAGPDVVETSTISTTADAAILAQTGGTTMTTGPTDPTFGADIYPRLQKAGSGGLGCANCHTAGGTGAVLQYDLPAATVLANMKAIAGVINLTTPASSLLLVRPLYEQPPTPQDHPNATFIDINDPDYKLFLLWITKGAKP